MLDKYDYEKISDDISDSYINDNIPLNNSIKIVSIKMELNPEQIKRLSETANIKTYNKMFDKLDDKTFKFDLADSKKVIDEVYTPTEKEDKSEAEDTSENKKKKEDDFTADSLKIPRKDYLSEDEEKDREQEKKEDVDAIPPMDTKQEDKEAAVKLAFNLDNKWTVDSVKKELDARILLHNETYQDELRKFAYVFPGRDKEEKFVQFVKNANAYYEDSNLFDVISGIGSQLKLDMSYQVKDKSAVKVASIEDNGMKQLGKCLDTYRILVDTVKARNLLGK